MAYSEKQREYNKKYDAKTYKIQSIKMKKENVAALDRYIKVNNITSKNRFIIDLINAAIGYNDK